MNFHFGGAETGSLELDAVFGGAFAGLEFVQGGFGAFEEDFVVGDRGVEAAMSSRRLVSPSRRSVKKSGSSTAGARSWSSGSNLTLGALV